MQRKRRRCWKISLGGWTNWRMTHYLKLTSIKQRWVQLAKTVLLLLVYKSISLSLSLLVSLSLPQFQFQNVRFMIPHEQRLVVTNPGRRPVHIYFVPKLNEKNICKPWLEVKPVSAVIQPCKWDIEALYLHVHVPIAIVSWLNACAWLP